MKTKTGSNPETIFAIERNCKIHKALVKLGNGKPAIVILRTIDVLEGRQELGKPKEGKRK